jgi:hypothetical protein
MKSDYIQGETIKWDVMNISATAISLQLGDKAYAFKKEGDAWQLSLDSSKLSGRLRFAIFATLTNGDKDLIDSGFLTVRPLVSKYRAVVEAIDTALQGVATNGKYSVSVGELSMTDKTFDEMLKAKAYYSTLADEEETGESTTGKVATIQTRFG